MTTTHLPPMPEADLQDAVIQLLQLKGWRLLHSRPGMTSRVDRKGKPVWVTPLQGDPGFPDLEAAHAQLHRTFHAELKAEGRYPDRDQRLWLDVLLACGQEVYCWYPHDLRDGTIARVIFYGPRPEDLWVPKARPGRS